MTTPALLTTKEAAAFLQVSEKTLEKWRTKGTGPKFRRLGHRTVRYLQADLIAWPGMTTNEAQEDNPMNEQTMKTSLPVALTQVGVAKLTQARADAVQAVVQEMCRPTVVARIPNESR